MSERDASAPDRAARVRVLEQKLAQDPRSPVFAELGRLLLDARENERARAVLASGLEHHPRHAQGLMCHGEALLRLGQLRAAAEALQAMLDVAPGRLEAMLLLARALDWDGRTTEARGVLLEAQSLEPDNPRVKGALARLDGPTGATPHPVDDTTAQVKASALIDEMGGQTDDLDLSGLGISDSFDTSGLDGEPTEAMSRDALLQAEQSAGQSTPANRPVPRNPSASTREIDARGLAGGLAARRTIARAGGRPDRAIGRPTVRGVGPTPRGLEATRELRADDLRDASPGGRSTIAGPPGAAARQLAGLARPGPSKPAAPTDRATEAQVSVSDPATGQLSPTGPGIIEPRRNRGSELLGSRSPVRGHGRGLESLLAATRELNAGRLAQGASPIARDTVDSGIFDRLEQGDLPRSQSKRDPETAPGSRQFESTRELNARDLERAGLASKPQSARPAADLPPADAEDDTQPRERPSTRQIDVGERDPPRPTPRRRASNSGPSSPMRPAEIPHPDDRPTVDDRGGSALGPGVNNAWISAAKGAAAAEPPESGGDRPVTVHLPRRRGESSSRPEPAAASTPDIPHAPLDGPGDAGRPVERATVDKSMDPGPRLPADDGDITRPQQSAGQRGEPSDDGMHSTAALPAARQRDSGPRAAAIDPLDQQPTGPHLRAAPAARGQTGEVTGKVDRRQVGHSRRSPPSPSPRARGGRPAPPPMPNPRPRRPAGPAPDPRPRPPMPDPTPRPPALPDPAPRPPALPDPAPRPPAAPMPDPRPRPPASRTPAAGLPQASMAPPFGQAPAPPPFGQAPAPPPSIEPPPAPPAPPPALRDHPQRLDTRPPDGPGPSPDPHTNHSLDDTRSRSAPWLRIALLGLGVLALLVALIATLRYRRAVDDQEAAVNAAITQLADGNYASRLSVGGALAQPVEPPGPLVRLGDWAARLTSRPGLDGPAGQRAALLARVEAERVLLFGDRERRPEADSRLSAAQSAAPEALDTRIAEVALALVDGDRATARTRLEQLTEGQLASADGAWLSARVALAEGELDAALEHAERAAQQDIRHPFAPTLIARLKAMRGDNTTALETLEQLLESDRAEHVDTRIDFERLRIRANKRAGEAVTTLQALLDDRSNPLSPGQAARVHDSIGLYHEQAGELSEARQAFVAAMNAAPGDPRFVAGLARLDLRSHRLDAAEEVLERAAAAAPGEAQWLVLLARVDLDRGQPEEALSRLEGVTAPDAEVHLARAQARLALADEQEGEARLKTLRAAEADARAARRNAPGLLDASVVLNLIRYLGERDRTHFDALRADRALRPDSGQRLLDRTLPLRAYARAETARKRYRVALRQYESAIEVEPTDFRAHYGVCRAATARLDSRRALKACRATLEQNEHFVPAGRLLGRVAEAWRDAGAVTAALEALRTRGALDPSSARRLARAYVEQDAVDRALALVEGEDAVTDDATVRYIKGLSASALGKLGEGRDLLYTAADQLTGDSWVQLAYADLLLKQDQAPESAAYYRRAMTADSEPFAALGLAHAELDRREWDAARIAAREAERRAARSLSHPRVRAEALAVQARALVGAGGRRDLRRASRLLRKANAVEPDLRDSLLAAGLLAEKQRKPDTAIARYRRLTQVFPRDPEGYYRLGRLLIEEPRTRELAVAELNKASELDPEGVWGARSRGLLKR